MKLIVSEKQKSINGIMFGYLAKWAYFILLSSSHVFCDYDCVCNYAVETSVYGSADTSGQPIGYLYEFDCKPTASGNQAVQNFYAVQFEKQVCVCQVIPYR